MVSAASVKESWETRQDLVNDVAKEPEQYLKPMSLLTCCPDQLTLWPI
jgi:hypothetical protein